MQATRIPRRSKAWFAAAIAALCLTTAGGAVNGGLDPSFGSGGIVLTDLAGSGDMIQDVATDGSGRIVAAGTTWQNGKFVFALTRYLPDGTLDATFGAGGMVTLDFNDEAAIPSSVAIDDQGRIVVGGEANVPDSQGSQNDLALARFNEDGSVDTSFGPDGTGRVTTNLGDRWFDEITDLAIDTSGRIVVSAYQWAAGARPIVLARYNHNGSLDATFGDGGIVMTFLTHSAYSVAGLALAADGRILVAGTVINGAGADARAAAVLRYNSNGSLDSAFGSDGVSTADLGVSEQINAVALDNAGRILVAGTTGGAFLVARLNADGSLDPSFSGDGYTTIDVGGLENDIANDVRVDAAGGIAAVGVSTTSDFMTSLVAVARLRADGTPDTSFGSGGSLTTDIGPSAWIPAAALDAGGNLVAGGQLCDVSAQGPEPLTCDFAVLRYTAMASGFSFSGFFPPVHNPPAVNVVKAGKAVPVKFSLHGYFGLDILAAGSPSSQAVPCNTETAQDLLSETVSAGASSLTYDVDTDQYVYVWKTDKSWANTCRQLVVTLTDGTSHTATFRFSR